MLSARFPGFRIRKQSESQTHNCINKTISFCTLCSRHIQLHLSRMHFFFSKTSCWSDHWNISLLNTSACSATKRGSVGLPAQTQMPSCPKEMHLYWFPGINLQNIARPVCDLSTELKNVSISVLFGKRVPGLQRRKEVSLKLVISYCC